MIPDEAESRKRREDALNGVPVELLLQKRRGTDAVSYSSLENSSKERCRKLFRNSQHSSLTNSESNLRSVGPSRGEREFVKPFPDLITFPASSIFNKRKFCKCN